MATSDEIVSAIKELRSIHNEIATLRAHYKTEMKKLKPRQMELESLVQTYLEENNQTGVKVGPTVIMLSEKKKYNAPKRKEEKLKAGEEALKKYGIRQPLPILNSIFEALKGEPIMIHAIKLKQERSKLEYKDLS
jgi:hypothetical protein